MSISQLAANAANLAMQIVIARFLGPAEFGIYALCFAIDQMINCVGAFSLGHGLVQAEGEASQRDCDTVMLLCGAQGLAGLAIAAAIAPFVGAERGAQAAWILIVLAVARMLRLLAQTPEAVLDRQFRFARSSAILGISATTPNVVAVGLASLGFGAMSLAVRDLLVAALLIGLNFASAGYRFRGQWSRESAARIMTFGRPMFVSRSVEILIERLDNLAVGIFFGNFAAGIYHTARFVSEAGSIAARPMDRLALNLYARLQNDRARLARAWDLTNYVLLRVMLAGASILLLQPVPTIELLYGDDWLEVAPLLRWLGLYGGLFPIFHNVKNLLYGTGHVSAMLHVRYVQLSLFITTVALAAWFDDLGAMAAGLLATTLTALALAWRRTLPLVARPSTARLVVPFAVLAATAALVSGAEASGMLSGVPRPLLPLLPPLVFTIGIFAAEGATPIRELRYLLDQARGES